MTWVCAQRNWGVLVLLLACVTSFGYQGNTAFKPWRPTARKAHIEDARNQEVESKYLKQNIRIGSISPVSNMRNTAIKSKDTSDMTMETVVSEGGISVENSTCLSFTGPTCRQITMRWENGPRRILMLAKPDKEIMPAFVQALHIVARRKVAIYVESAVFQWLEENDMCDLEFQCISDLALHEKESFNEPNGEIYSLDRSMLPHIDLIVTFGGDGLLLHTNTLFGDSIGSIPPVMSFDFGSLGFLAPFRFEDFEEEVNRLFTGNVMMTLRMRLQCTLTKNNETLGPFHCLNEAVIDRGPSPYLSAIDLDCDDQYLTTVQADGLIIATPTGSTAYSLAAGGSMVHPSVPAMLLTPICAHTLSFRPLALPDSSLLACSIPIDSRSTAWVSFDGKFRQEMSKGDRLEIRMSKYPMPTVNRLNYTGDWFDSLRSGFMFNQRPRQKSMRKDQMLHEEKKPQKKNWDAEDTYHADGEIV